MTMICKIKEEEEKKGALWEKEEIFKKVRREEERKRGREGEEKRRGHPRVKGRKGKESQLISNFTISNKIPSI